MTRRLAAAAMLARYGSETSYGGKTFLAFVRQMNFFSGKGRNTPDGPDSGLRYSYVGPAAHKLIVGGTVTSGGADYVVKQCETVLVAGEELFVRAILAPLPPLAVTDVRLERNGKTVAHAESCTVRAICGADEVVPWGENGPADLTEGTVAWKLTLSGLRPENEANPFSPETFRVVVERKDGQAVYSGCRWTEITETGGLTEALLNTVEVLAVSREEAKTDG